MPISAEPIFFDVITRNEGVRHKLTTLTNVAADKTEVEVIDVVLPEWAELETLIPGATLALPGHGKRDFTVIVNTNHQFFPEEEEAEDQIKIAWSNDEETMIPVYLTRIIQEVPVFQGIFALDFGTTNSCYAYKHPLQAHVESSSGLDIAEVSKEIPSAIFFEDAQAKKNPHYRIGIEALQRMKEHPEKTYAYFLSIKRSLGTNKKRPFLVVDASPNTYSQRWHEVDIGSFIVRAILKDAQDILKQRIHRVVCTFPTLFSKPRKEALTEAVNQALVDIHGARKIPKNAVTLQVDEACGAAFGFIYEEIQRQFEVQGYIQDFNQSIVAYDFGGGTIDIALLDVRVEVNRTSGHITIHQEVKGLSGDPYYGGDNVTLQVFNILKHRVAQKVARWRKDKAEEEKRKAAESEASALDAIFAAPTEKKAADPFSAIKDSFKEDAAGKQDDQAPLEEPLAPQVSEADYLQAIETLVEFEGVLTTLASSRVDTRTALVRWLDANAKRWPRDEIEAKATEIQKAIDIVVPTRWQAFSRSNEPKLERLARRMFYELWHEADTAKIRSVMSDNHQARVQSLDSLAKYNSVPPEVLTEVFVELSEIDRRIEDDVDATVRKAHGLYERAEQQAGVASDGFIQMEEAKPHKHIQVLLAGNASRMPIVARKFTEVFKIPEQELLRSASALKGVVALGACQEAYLRSAFGKGGLIELKSTDFTERLPFALGLCNPNLKLIGLEHGFCPIFTRGMTPGERVYTPATHYALIHEGVQILEMYADHRDGARPTPVGLFDLTKPSEDLTQAEHERCYDQIQAWAATPENTESLARWRKENNKDDGDMPFGFLIELLDDWDLRLIDVDKNFVYHLTHKEEAPDPTRNPFSGEH